MKPRLSVAAVIAALPWTLGVGCDLFSTREPILGEVQQSAWIPPTSAEIVVSNLEAALEGQNFADYERAMIEEEYVFHADPADVDALTLELGKDPFASWNRAVEVETAQNTWTNLDSLSLGLTPIDDDGGVPVALLKYDYSLTVHSSDGSTLFRGEAWFQIRQLDNGEWYIFDWVDVASSPQNDSWGRLKGRNRTSN